MQFNDYPCSNCNQPLNLSLLVGQPHIQPNATTCHICHQPYDKIRKYNPSVFCERLPDVTQEELDQLKPQEQKEFSGETRECRCCKQAQPIERFTTFLANNKTHYTVCHFCMREQAKDFYANNKDEVNRKNKERWLSLSDEEKILVRQKRNNARKLRERANPEYYKLLNRRTAQKNRLIRRVRNRLSQFLKGEKKGSTANMIGCSQKELISHLESKFMAGMSWDNYGYGPDKWVIDHIKPMHMFNDGTGNKDALKPANHYTNLQPLWFDMNDAKNGHYDPDHPMGWHGLDKFLIERGEPTPWIN